MHKRKYKYFTTEEIAIIKHFNTQGHSDASTAARLPDRTTDDILQWRMRNRILKPKAQTKR